MDNVQLKEKTKELKSTTRDKMNEIYLYLVNDDFDDNEVGDNVVDENHFLTSPLYTYASVGR